MSQLAHNPAYLTIEDQLDAMGQKFRVQRVVRGAMLFVSELIVSGLVAAYIAHLAGPGWVTLSITLVWATWILGSAIVWLVRPLMLRPTSVEMARLIESRIKDLHNGLTNSVLLAHADDLAENPWLGQVLDEIAVTSQGKSLGDAIKLSDLRQLGWRLLAVVGTALVLAGLCRGQVMHGWSQMAHPTDFVAKVGVMEIVDVQPKDVTLVMGQPLEVTLIAKGPQTPTARLIFDKKFPEVVLSPTESSDGALRYSYRIEHVEESVKYRLEVGGTQTSWYSVNVVRQVKLSELTLKVTAPAYAKQAPKLIEIKPSELDKTAVEVPQGSRVELTATIDVPVKAAMLQMNEDAPVAVAASMEGRRFDGEVTILDDSSLSLLLTDGSGQIISRLPEQNFVIKCVKDAAPEIKMIWPAQDATISPQQEVKIQAMLKDDMGLSSWRVLMSASQEQSMVAMGEGNYLDQPKEMALDFVLNLTPEQKKHGQSVWVQVEATDNRNLANVLKDGGPQVTTSARIEIKIRDAEQLSRELKDKADKLRERLMEMLKLQKGLYAHAVTFTPGNRAIMPKVHAGQSDLRIMLQQTAETFEFQEDSRTIQKTLLLLVTGTAKEAVDLAAAVQIEPVARQQTKLNGELQTRQRRIISTLESLLAFLQFSAEPTSQPSSKQGSDLVNRKDALEKLNEALKQFEKEERRIMEQMAPLVKKPVDRFDDNDKKLLDKLMMSQEKMDNFMQEAISDFSKVPEQDMANSSMSKELSEIYTEMTMLKDALKSQVKDVPVPYEEIGDMAETAKEMSNNLERWLMEHPDRLSMPIEDQLVKKDAPMPELPKELTDMVGELMEQEEDLFDQLDHPTGEGSTSDDKGIGWDAMDGNQSSMLAKGVTGNQLPKNNELGGRSGEGRSGKSNGEFAEDTATGKGGRPTPTRLDPTAYEKGQVKDTSKDPVGGATGGGKMSGQGGRGLEGSVPPKVKAEMQRLTQKQAELRNKAERLNLQYQLGRYDNFKLQESLILMRRVESDLQANRYDNALRRRDALLDTMDTSRMLLGGRIHVQEDTTPVGSRKVQEEINDAMKGQLPAAWSEAIKQYYKKLAAE